MLPTLSSVAKDGLAMAKKTIRNSRVMKGAMLLSRLRSHVIVRDELAGAVLSGAAGWGLLLFSLLTSPWSRPLAHAPPRRRALLTASPPNPPGTPPLFL